MRGNRFYLDIIAESSKAVDWDWVGIFCIIIMKHTHNHNNELELFKNGNGCKQTTLKIITSSNRKFIKYWYFDKICVRNAHLG